MPLTYKRNLMRLLIWSNWCNQIFIPKWGHQICSLRPQSSVDLIGQFYAWESIKKKNRLQTGPLNSTVLFCFHRFYFHNSLFCFQGHRDKLPQVSHLILIHHLLVCTYLTFVFSLSFFPFFHYLLLSFQFQRKKQPMVCSPFLIFKIKVPYFIPFRLSINKFRSRFVPAPKPGKPSTTGKLFTFLCCRDHIPFLLILPNIHLLEFISITSL